MASLNDYEVQGSPVESREGFRLRATRTFVVPWDDRYTYRGQLLSLPGAIYPYNSELFEARCRSVSVTPFGAYTRMEPSGMLSYPNATIVAEYSTAVAGSPESDPDDPNSIISETFEPTMEFLTLDYNGFFWDPFGSQLPLQADEAPGILVQGAKYTVTRHNLAFIRPEILSWAGSCNSLPMSMLLLGSPPITFAAEQVIYMTPSINIERAPDGTRRYSATLPFAWKNIPSWNRFFHAANYDSADPDAAWSSIYKAGGGDAVKPYPPRDLTQLRIG